MFTLNSKIRKAIFFWREQGVTTDEDTALLLAALRNRMSYHDTISNRLGNWAKLLVGVGAVACCSAVLYFFAANWSGLSELAKVTAVLIILAIPYGAVIVLPRMSSFFYHLCVFSGLIIFGVALGLVGQIYNSQADSFLLFLIWVLPALVYSALFRKERYPATAVILLNLTAFTYFPLLNVIRGEVLLLIYLAVNVLILSVLFPVNNSLGYGRLGLFLSTVFAAISLSIFTFSPIGMNEFFASLIYVAVFVFIGWVGVSVLKDKALGNLCVALLLVFSLGRVIYLVFEVLTDWRITMLSGVVLLVTAHFLMKFVNDRMEFYLDIPKAPTGESDA